MSPENLTPLAYTRLEPGQIRLLYPDIRDGREDHWFLEEATLLDDAGWRTHLEYDALSYTWGEDQVTTFAVNCNGKELRVHHNLNDALPFLARRDSQLPIWIDAICINQADNDEKKVQIGMMRQIYEGASTVWVWLGLGNESSGDIIAILQQKREDPVYERTGLERTIESIVTNAGHEIIPWLSSDEAWSTYNDLAENPWYSRLWVFQEVALAKRIRVLLGPHEVGWGMLRNLLEHVARRSFVGGDGQLPQPHSKYTNNVFKVRRERRRALASGKFTVRNLCNVLLFTIGTACREPADRVWALAGFSDIDVPNGASIVDMYVQLALSVLVPLQPTSSQWWELLHSATSLSKRSDLFSWCPDFHDARGRTSLPGRIFKLEGLLGSGEERFAASRKQNRPQVPLNLHSKQLVLCGHIFDRVDKIYPQWNEEDLYADQTLSSFHAWETSMALAVFRSVTSNNEQDSSINTQESGKVQITANDYWSTLRGGYADDGGATPMSWEAFKLVKAQFENLSFLSQSAFAQSQMHYFRDICKHSPELQKYVQVALWVSLVQDKRCCFSTAQGRFCFGPSNITVGDSVCILSFATTTHIIRRTPDSDEETYTLVGEAYVHGMMHGEIGSLDIEEQEVVLV